MYMNNISGCLGGPAVSMGTVFMFTDSSGPAILKSYGGLPPVLTFGARKFNKLLQIAEPRYVVPVFLNREHCH